MPEDPVPFVIAVPVYEGVDLLDVAAPCEMFNWFKDAVKDTLAVDWRVVAKTKKPVTTRGGLKIKPQDTFAKTRVVDLLWVPGGDLKPLKKTMRDKVYLDFLRTRSRAATYVVSVCEGAMLLGSAGLLRGHTVTTHWAFYPCLKRFPGVRGKPGFPRFVISALRPKKGKKRYLVTGGGISSGLDEALQLIQMIAGEDVAKSVQLSTQYFPDPPVKGEIPPPDGCPLDDVSA